MAKSNLTDRPDTSPKACAERAAAVKSAYGHNRIEGLEPSPKGREVHQWWVRGEVTADEAVAILIRHYTGRTQA